MNTEVIYIGKAGEKRTKLIRLGFSYDTKTREWSKQVSSEKVGEFIHDAERFMEGEGKFCVYRSFLTNQIQRGR